MRITALGLGPHKIRIKPVSPGSADTEKMNKAGIEAANLKI